MESNENNFYRSGILYNFVATFLHLHVIDIDVKRVSVFLFHEIHVRKSEFY